MLMVVSAASCQPRPTSDRRLLATRAAGPAGARPDDPDHRWQRRHGRLQIGIADSREDLFQLAEKRSRDRLPPRTSSWSRSMAATRSCSSTPSSGADSGRSSNTGTILPQRTSLGIVSGVRARGGRFEAGPYRSAVPSRLELSAAVESSDLARGRSRTPIEFGPRQLRGGPLHNGCADHCHRHRRAPCPGRVGGISTAWSGSATGPRRRGPRSTSTQTPPRPHPQPGLDGARLRGRRAGDLPSGHSGPG